MAVQLLMDPLLTSRTRTVKVRVNVPNDDGALKPGMFGRATLEVERLEASAPELAELRLLHLVISGAAGFTDEESAEVNRLVAGGTLRPGIEGRPEQGTGKRRRN